MDYLVITKQRLLKHLQQINNGIAPGVYDWFVGEGNILHVLLAINGVNYIYREQFETVDDLDSLIRISLSKDNEVLGFLRVEEEEEPVPENIDPFLYEVKFGANRH